MTKEFFFLCAENMKKALPDTPKLTSLRAFPTFKKWAQMG